MCILFTYVGAADVESDYALVLASNRDEFYDRPAANLQPWNEDPDVIGGRDLQTGCNQGTWLAFSPLRQKIGVLLNLPGLNKENAQSRGAIVADYIKSSDSTADYVQTKKSSMEQCNEFILITLEDLGSSPNLQSYSNANDKLHSWTAECNGFGNSLPEIPLKKVVAGREKLKDIHEQFKKINQKELLINELITLLQSEERHLPDKDLEKRRPTHYEQLSSIFVKIPEERYGTRTHTIILITKTGHVDVIEVSLQPPIDILNPSWLTTELQCDI